MLRHLILMLLMVAVVVVAQRIKPTIATTAAPPPAPPTVNNCPGGECVPYYQCSNNSHITDGDGIINVRFDIEPQRCVEYLESCCGMDDITDDEPTTQSPFLSSNGCGYRNPKGVEFKIAEKDSESEFGEFPWMVALLKREQIGTTVTEKYICGGSLIHSKVVLTAAHCTHGRQINSLKIRAGEWDTQTELEILPHQDRDVAEISIHPQYNKRNLFNDISLVILSGPVILEKHIQPICLPPSNQVFDHSRCATSGWGKDIFGSKGIYQVILKKVELPIVPRDTCQASLRRTRLGNRFILNESFICAGGERGKDACKGDGGSPLVCPIPNTKDRYYQSGIVAWGIGCGEYQIPGAYANVAIFRQWIDVEFANRGLDSSSYIAF